MILRKITKIIYFRELKSIISEDKKEKGGVLIGFCIMSSIIFNFYSCAIPVRGGYYGDYITFTGTRFNIDKNARIGVLAIQEDEIPRIEEINSLKVIIEATLMARGFIISKTILPLNLTCGTERPFIPTREEDKKQLFEVLKKMSEKGSDETVGSYVSYELCLNYLEKIFQEMGINYLLVVSMVNKFNPYSYNVYLIHLKEKLSVFSFVIDADEEGWYKNFSSIKDKKWVKTTLEDTESNMRKTYYLYHWGQLADKIGDIMVSLTNKK